MMMLMQSCASTKIDQTKVCPQAIFPSMEVMEDMRNTHKEDSATALWYFDIIRQQAELSVIE